METHIPFTMYAFINLFFMFVTAVLTLFFYHESNRAGKLEKTAGKLIFAVCTRYRMISSIFMVLHILQYGLYALFPINTYLPAHYPMSYWMNLLLASAIAFPSGYILRLGAGHAGEETMIVRKRKRMFGGIYHHIRHPQAVGEIGFLWVFSLVLDSPFLSVFSLIWIPIFYLMCLSEEKDLVFRYGNRYLSYKKRTGMFFPKTDRKP